ncbi:MarR family transcriptional regulator [Ruegeria arenilitoris]|uniref:MarR family transcriptional regulator n=1 Tax=Ruegeria arenilitoris TaxID=1173585 RepID=UPI00147E0122|nr:MarR family transcriptional regulator [Ruegeria arenilitoris]
MIRIFCPPLSLALLKADNRSVGGLGDALALESNTATPLLKRMESADLVRRLRNPQDERGRMMPS